MLRADAFLLGALVIGGVLLNAWLTDAAGFDLHYDEAQYWEWAQQLDWSYYSKGPLVAWSIALSTGLFGHGEWQVRLFGWIAHGVFLVLIFCFARDVWGNRAAAWWATLIAATIPVFFTLGLVMTTDNYLFVFWTWALWAMYRALFMARPGAWIEVGFAVGLGALTKLSIGLLPAFAGLWVVARADLRPHLKNPLLWGGLLLMLLIMSPMLYWNSTHDWVMLRHELGHVENEDFSVARGFELLASQVLAFSPLVVLLAVGSLYRPPQDSGRLFLWGLSLLWIAFFIFKAMGGKVQINWPAASFIALVILFAGVIPHWSIARRRVLVAAMASSGLLVAVLCFPANFGIDGASVASIRKMKAWRAPVAELYRQSGDVDFILAPEYVIAGNLAFYWPKRVPVYIEGDPQRRMNQHDLWPGIAREQGRTAVFVHYTPARPEELARAFKKCVELAPVPAIDQDGVLARTLYASRCEDYQHIAWPRSPNY